MRHSSCTLVSGVVGVRSNPHEGIRFSGCSPGHLGNGIAGGRELRTNGGEGGATMASPGVRIKTNSTSSSRSLNEKADDCSLFGFTVFYSYCSSIIVGEANK